ncbi:MAG: hypothetical protein LBR80_01695 [Deltaproteobacteria bacterium]|jgi:hypothetical protein|nr:hypothetical protein [Deltaproteobacteria bacterium]
MENALYTDADKARLLKSIAKLLATTGQAVRIEGPPEDLCLVCRTRLARVINTWDTYDGNSAAEWRGVQELEHLKSRRGHAWLKVYVCVQAGTEGLRLCADYYLDGAFACGYELDLVSSGLLVKPVDPILKIEAGIAETFVRWAGLA